MIKGNLNWQQTTPKMQTDKRKFELATENMKAAN
jgi:hypothetical protein